MSEPHEPRPDTQEHRTPGPENQEPQEPEAGPRGNRRSEPPLVAFGIVIGTAVGGVAGLIVGAFLLGAGVGCAAGVIIGAAAQALHSRG